MEKVTAATGTEEECRDLQRQVDAALGYPCGPTGHAGSGVFAPDAIAGTRTNSEPAPHPTDKSRWCLPLVALDLVALAPSARAKVSELDATWTAPDAKPSELVAAPDAMELPDEPAP